MKTKLVKIGRSLGVRIPKALIAGAHLNGHLEIELRGDEVVVRNAGAHTNGGKRRGASRTKGTKAGVVDHEWLNAPLVDDGKLPAW